MVWCNSLSDERLNEMRDEYMDYVAGKKHRRRRALQGWFLFGVMAAAFVVAFGDAYLVLMDMSAIELLATGVFAISIYFAKKNGRPL